MLVDSLTMERNPNQGLKALAFAGKRMIVRIDTRLITDWASFHDVFARSFGFPDYYGRNMDAWNDCMT
jgi:hypothetical protein